MKNNYYLSIAIPTRNNSLLLETGIFKIIKKINELDINISIFDNSDDELTYKLVKNYQEKYSNISYYGTDKILSYGENCTRAFLLPKSEYVFVIGDSITINEKDLEHIFYFLKKNSYEYVILNLKNRVNDIKEKIYKDNVELFSDLAWHCTLIGSTIYNKKIIEICEKRNIFTKYLKDPFIQVGILFEGINLLEKSEGIFLDKEFIAINNYKKKSSWANETFYVFGIKWINFIEGLPEIYEVKKKKVILDHGIKSGLFRVKSFLGLRANGYFTKKDYYTYREIFPKITNVKLKVIFLISIIPKIFLQLIKKIYRKLKI
ncbi:glycosyltransferase [Fusobacterium sp. THCT1E2]